MINSILNTGLNGVQAGTRTLNEAAQDIASLNTAPESTAETTPETAAGNGTNDLISALVDLKVGENQVRASAQVIQTGQETLGTLIDIVV